MLQQHQTHADGEAGVSAPNTAITCVTIPRYDAELSARAIASSQQVVSIGQSAFENSAFSRWVDAMQTVSGRCAGVVDAFSLAGQLGGFFSAEFLHSVRILPHAAVPPFPWSAVGVPSRPWISPSESAAPQGLSLRDAYIIRVDLAQSLPTHMCQLAQVAQWRMLGDIGYLYASAADYVRSDSQQLSLAMMAQRMAERAIASSSAFDFVKAVRQDLAAVWP